MTDNVEKGQQQHYPGLTVSRDGDAIVVRIPVRFHRRNGRQMVLTHGGNPAGRSLEIGCLLADVAKLEKSRFP